MKIAKIAEIFTRDDVESFDVEELKGVEARTLSILTTKTLVMESSRLINIAYQYSKINWFKLRAA